MADKDYYKILSVNNNASADEIKKAYRRLAMQYHPDRNHGQEEWANERFKEINEAYGVLGDPEKRGQYDHWGTVGNLDDVFGDQVVRSAFDDLGDDRVGAGLRFDFVDSIFDENLRGTGFAFRTFRRRFDGTAGTKFEPHGGDDLEELLERARNPEASTLNYEVVLSKEQALEGVEKELLRKGKRLRVTIPPGVKTGSRIRLKNALKTTDGKPGDIVITVDVK